MRLPMTYKDLGSLPLASPLPLLNVFIFDFSEAKYEKHIAHRKKTQFDLDDAAYVANIGNARRLVEE